MFKFFNYFRFFLISFFSIISCHGGELTMMLTSLHVGGEQYTKNPNSNVFTGTTSGIHYKITSDYSQVNFSLNGFSGDLPLTFSCKGQEPCTFSAKPIEGCEKQEFEDLPKYDRNQLLSDYSNLLNRDTPIVGIIPFEWKIDHENLGEVIVGLNYHFKVIFGEPKVANDLKGNFSIVCLQYGDSLHKPFLFEVLRLSHQKLAKKSLPSVFYDRYGYWRKEKEITWGLGEEDKQWLETNNLGIISPYQGEDTKKSQPLSWKILKGFDDGLKGKRLVIENYRLKPSPFVYRDEHGNAFVTIIEKVDLKESKSNNIFTLELLKPTHYPLFHSEKPKGKFEFNCRAFYKCVEQKENELGLIQQWEELNADIPHTTSFTSGFGEGAFCVLDLTKCPWKLKDREFWDKMTWFVTEGEGYLNPNTLPNFIIKYAIGTYPEDQKKKISKYLMWLADPFFDKGAVTLQGDELYIDPQAIRIRNIGKRTWIENLVSQKNIECITVDNLQSYDFNNICEISSSGKLPENMKVRSYYGDLIYEDTCSPHEKAIAALTHCLEKIVIANEFRKNWNGYPTPKLWDLMNQCKNLKEIRMDYVSIGYNAYGEQSNGSLEIAHERWANLAYKLRGVKYLDVQGAKGDINRSERMDNGIFGILENNADSLISLKVRKSECLYWRFNRFNQAVKGLLNLEVMDIRDNVLSNNQTVYFSETLSKLPKLREVRIDMPYSILPGLSSFGYLAANQRGETWVFPLYPLIEPFSLLIGEENVQYVDTIINLTKISCLTVLELQIHGLRRNEAWVRQKINDFRQEANKNPIRQITLS